MSRSPSSDNESNPLSNLWRMIRPHRLTDEGRQEVIDGILEGAFASRRFYILLALSTTIAALGLLANSTAVIIGAMIIAPLMGPILGVALGMVSVNHVIERRSLIAEVTGVLLAIAIGYVVGLFPIHPGPGSEMLARTSPTIYDIGIALASGLAGGYASVNRAVNSALAGVAISVALVPPLATCGLFLSMRDWEHSFGAFLLFVANYFCIQMAAAFVFWSFRLHRERAIQRNGIWRYRLKFVPGLIALLAMSWFMTGTLIGLVRDQQFESRFRMLLNEQISKRTGGRLDEILSRQALDGGYKVVASALTPKAFDSEQVAQIESELRRHFKTDLTLILRSIISQDVDHTGRVFFNEQEKQEAMRSALAATHLEQARSVLLSHLATIPGASLDSLESSEQDSVEHLVAFINAPQPLSSDRVKTIEEDLKAKLQTSLRLIARCTSTTVVSKDGVLYTQKPTEIIPPIVTALRGRVESVLRERFAAKPPRYLKDLKITEAANRIQAEAEAVATVPVRPAEVLAIQRDLQRYVDPRIKLRIKTTLSAEADADGWMPPRIPRAL